MPQMGLKIYALSHFKCISPFSATASSHYTRYTHAVPLWPFQHMRRIQTGPPQGRPQPAAHQPRTRQPTLRLGSTIPFSILVLALVLVLENMTPTGSQLRPYDEEHRRGLVGTGAYMGSHVHTAPSLVVVYPAHVDPTTSHRAPTLLFRILPPQNRVLPLQLRSKSVTAPFTQHPILMTDLLPASRGEPPREKDEPWTAV
ncbi:hypothetical protein CC1G_14039 [Coprinopsis cinerea okayama7|uniref:Uncharacterized protein n=1 Tax=Coprinopsis cinerea (strain Okayama-7 / 130 / ATCC MYA-4618 / FGSC 9003) TaxID=240176 RepID=D6RL15_COPC7|nr:hypothetical protein CC1G_14039 [Coprinopsis cinerea okayama7\|eukprot:XP_002912001.1 hypothetical protein CC1G_14039 [Coprinopsis cinerea okayama7\